MRFAPALLAFTTLGAAACRERTGADPAPNPGIGSGVSERAPEAQRMYPAVPSSFVDLVATARRSVVAIRAAQPVKSGPAAMFPGAPETTADVSLGTGFLVEAKGVYVVTTYKIAMAAPDLRVVLDDTTEVPAKVIGRDVNLDLALLSVDRPRLTPLPLGDSNDVKIGEWVVVLGNPFGEEVTASAGVLSSSGRDAAGSLLQDGIGSRTFRLFLQTDARIHRGNSGGPMLDTAGQVIGIALATGDRPGELSFALPINRFKEVVASLRDNGQVSRSWLGAKVKPVTADLAEQLGMPNKGGAYVTEVVAASPAARSALRAGDVILKWGEHPVDHRTLPWLVASAPSGQATTMLVWRNRTEVPIAVVAERMPE